MKELGIDVLVFHPSPVATRFYDKVRHRDQELCSGAGDRCYRTAQPFATLMWAPQANDLVGCRALSGVKHPQMCGCCLTWHAVLLLMGSCRYVLSRFFDRPTSWTCWTSLRTSR